jgi:hypothetical protein
MFGGMIRGEIDCSICCCGFLEYVDFLFWGGSGLLIGQGNFIVVLICGCESWVRVYLVHVVVNCFRCGVLGIIYYQDVVSVLCVKGYGFSI